MSESLVISIDAMGGDHGPSVVVPAIARVRQTPGSEDIRFVLHGDPAVLDVALRASPAAAVSQVSASQSVISSDAKPAHAMRRGRGSSMWNAVTSVQTGEAHAAVSAGNTGALMAIARLQLRMVGGMDRPALVASWPTMRGVSSVLDVGANILCDADRLVEFAILGVTFHRAIHGVARPKVGILNVGVESEKGHEEVKGADKILSATAFDFDYLGFVEGDDIAKGAADVVVTDGFTGNVALKTAEGLARFFRSELRQALSSTTTSKIGAFIAQGALREMSRRLDPGAINGGPFLGLNGVVVKSHGGADAGGFANAINIAIELARGDFTRVIERDLRQRHPSPADAPTSAAA